MSDPTREGIAQAIAEKWWDLNAGETDLWSELSDREQANVIESAEIQQYVDIFAPALRAARAGAWSEGFDAGWAAQDPDNHAPNPYEEAA